MGGARCSYRNCTVRSDGVTHMFHYPVFDKLRCHQWLTNAQRHEFLNLKVSQLKNRVVCQHHFIPDNFMNFKMDKLKFDAIPTINGPFCEGDQSIQEAPVALPIGLDDIDIDQIMSCKDKRANFSVKYGDFLINSEMDPPLCKENSKIGSDYGDFVNNSELGCNFAKQKSQSQSLSKPKKSLNIVSIAEEETLLGDTNIYFKQIAPEINKTKKNQIHISKEETPLGDTNIYLKQITPEINKTRKNQIHIAKEETPLEDKNNYFNQITPETNKTRKNKIHIISEKKVSTPVSVTGQLKPVTPNQIINAREKEADNTILSHADRNIQVEIMIHHDPHVDITIPNSGTPFSNSQIIVNPQSGLLEQSTTSLPSLPLLNENYNANNTIAQNQEEHLKDINPLSVADSLQTMSKEAIEPFNYQIELTPLKQEAIEPFSIPIETTPLKPPVTQITSVTSNQSPPKSLLKHKIPPERAAAIQEKRQFNKKLRDMIEFCLDEAPEKPNSQNNKVKRNTNTDILKTTRELGKPLKVNKGTSQDVENKVVVLKSPRKEQSSQKVSSYLSKEPTLPSSSEYNMKFLESSLKKMEENLLLKITQNSKNILDLKRTLQPALVEKRSIMTQTKEDEETCKKQLYHEISQFLSPEANSLIYEELFLAKYLKKPLKKASGFSRKRKFRQS